MHDISINPGKIRLRPAGCYKKITVPAPFSFFVSGCRQTGITNHLSVYLVYNLSLTFPKKEENKTAIACNYI